MPFSNEEHRLHSLSKVIEPILDDDTIDRKTAMLAVGQVHAFEGALWNISGLLVYTDGRSENMEGVRKSTIDEALEELKETLTSLLAISEPTAGLVVARLKSEHDKLLSSQIERK